MGQIMRIKVNRIMVLYKPDKINNSHDRDELKLYPSKEVFIWNDQPICLLSKYQAKRLEKHFCGINGCQCTSGAAIQLDEEGNLWGIRVDWCENSWNILLEVLLESNGVIWGEKIRIIERLFAQEIDGTCSFWNDKRRAVLPIASRVISSRKKKEPAYILECPKFNKRENSPFDAAKIPDCKECECFVPKSRY